ncbi:hypothetical protein ANN_03921 [Periplaneta americana]|uniref:PiggyBac transposable element-derived protein domain-containing protein n=1 Tax=Periplaneta americana TaxID=6978 RepID=A0ABQ8T9I2_PERAM|nr:hypothetical protein ANN_03921 [Periplaneta americana]
MYLNGVFKSGNEGAKRLWNADGTGRDIFRATMSLDRFLFPLIAIWFDDPAKRELRKKMGIELPVLQKSLTDLFPSDFLTVDEMLVGFCGRCLFRMYIKSKPQKYGLKICVYVILKGTILLNAFIYSGKWNFPNPRNLSIPTQNILSLVMLYAHSNRNTTCDNWFSSVEQVDELLKFGLTYIGTIRKNKREIPEYIIPTKNDAEGTKKIVLPRIKP